MSVTMPIKKQEQAKVPNSQYIVTEIKPDEATKPSVPAEPAKIKGK